ncbi:myosin regulatory light chain RLC-A-like [Anopheles maculipalpis]|uniref:myosin regulatory light chain RLC-A-like n=1 Tax=Anopheles maculipalpis TaxID=1496333 RepID=UPI00215923FA|nr:myosin regulatory light chain RLC-A-like [Anopheles maculipalpis]
MEESATSRSKTHRVRKLTRRGTSNILSELQVHQITELRELFNLIDTNRTGVIERENLRAMLTVWMGCAPTEKELDTMLNDACGVPLNFTLFLTLFAKHLKDVDTPDTIRSAFQCMDTGNVGSVDENELRVWLTTKGDQRLSSEEVNEIFSRMERKDGRLEYDAFDKIFQSKPDQG